MQAVSCARPARWGWLALLMLLCLGATPVGAQVPLRLVKPSGPLSARLSALSRRDMQARPLAAQAQALGLLPKGQGSLLTDGSGRLLVYIQLDQLDPGFLAALSDRGARIVHVSERYAVVTAAVAPADLAALAATPGVLRVQEALAPRASSAASQATQPRPRTLLVQPGQHSPAVKCSEPSCLGDEKLQGHVGYDVQAEGSGECRTGGVVSEGDAVLRAAEARARYGVDGGGVTVGVLSGSFDVESVTSINAADDIAAGELPGPGNPCERTTPVRVLAESRTGTGRDEGRAMLQIVHDLAPGANLAFATASDGLFAFADNIRRLRAEAGADVIVDDFYYAEEPFFQDGPVNVAISDVAAAGAIYVTAGGNINVADSAGTLIGSYEAAAYRPAPCPTLFDKDTGAPFAPGNDCHDFDAGEGIDPAMGIALPVSGTLTLNFQWSEPWFGVKTDIDVYLVDAGGRVLGLANDTLGPAPFEFFGYANKTGAAQDVQLVAARFSGETPRIKFTLGSAAINTPQATSLEYAGSGSSDIFGPTVADHGAAAQAINVAAAPYNDPTRLEPFSSYGPAVIYWAPAESIRPAAPLPAPDVRVKPDLTATDGVRTSFFGRIERNLAQRCNPADPEQVCRFYGTSSSAPHVAGVAALVKQRANLYGVGLDQQVAVQILKATAAPLNGPPEAQGAGLVDALAAVGAAVGK